MKQQLLDTLEQIAGKENIHPNEPMSRHTTFRVGGPADVLVTPEAGKLAAVTGACREAGEPYYIVGNGSNLLVGDGGIRGVVILTRDGMDEISADGVRITAGAGALLSRTASLAASHALTGMEFAAGIPGTIGGAVVMNAGAYGGEMRATKVGEDSSIQRMIRLVQSADAGKARIVGLADRWATWIVVAALTAAALTGLITRDPIRAVTILVVFCPCALVLATPTAIMAAIGNATRHSFLVREGDALERLASVSQVTFDKTGTLTLGTPQVKLVESLLPDVSRDALYAWTAGAELRSEHPLGRAVVQGWRAETVAAPPETADFQMLPGRGVSATVAGHHLVAGNRELLTEEHVPWESLSQAAVPALEQGCTVIYVAVDGRPAGFLALADTLRPDAAGTIRDVRATGVTPVLLTGDHERAARHIAGELGIGTFQAECLPEDKLTWIDRSQQSGHLVCMVGDGINDAPALKRAHVGIAMGGVGSDIAVDAADIALVNDDIRELPHLLALSKRMMRTIKSNLAFSMTLNFIAIALAITGILNPVVGALVHNAGSVLVIVNSSLLLKWRKRP